MNYYYAVAIGKHPGIYTDWANCFMNISGYSNAKFKKCKTKEDALHFLSIHIQNPPPQNINSSNSKIPFYIYTDGSCSNNGRKNAKAGIGIYFGKKDPRNTSERFTNKPTNQRAELYAIIKAITLLTQEEIKTKKIIIYTDSQYSIHCVTKWYKTWNKNQWKTKKKQNVKNKKLIQQLYQLVNKYNIHLKHIHSHTNKTDIHSRGNVLADKLAVQGSLL